MKHSFAVCVNNLGYKASLELCKIYRILPDTDAAQHKQVRVVDESGEDYLYPAEFFSKVMLPLATKELLEDLVVA
jgi:hypothetical protein